jgi:predicted ester cyclase
MSESAPAGDAAPMPTPRALVQRLVEEGVNQGRLEVVDELLAPTRIGGISGADGRAALKQLLTAYRRAIPDARWTVSEQIAEGETVATCFVASGTHLGPLWGIPATGRRMAVPGILISRCREGRIVEQRLQLDLLELLQQLRVMPELGLDEEVMVARLLHESRSWTSEPHGRAAR